MSRAPIVSNTITHAFSSTKVDLPRANESYEEIFSYSGFGDLHSVRVAFNSDEVFLKIEIDNNTFIEVDLEDFDSLFGTSGDGDFSSILSFSNSKKVASYALGYPVQFKEGFKVFAKANSNSSTRDMKGYSIFYTRDNL